MQARINFAVTWLSYQFISFIMQESLLELLRCPVTRSQLTIFKIKSAIKILDNKEVAIIDEAILYASELWFYPVIKGIPRLNVEAVVDYEVFLKTHVPDYDQRKEKLLAQYSLFLDLVQRKNKRTKESFAKEWGLYHDKADKTWDADSVGILNRFLQETDETLDTLPGKIIFDAGCGNGTLNCLLAQKGIVNIAMDFSNSIEKPHATNQLGAVHFIQGDVQFPPVVFDHFDIVHCSGVLIHTNNTELSFSCIAPVVKPGGKLSVWLYHRRNNFIHNLFNKIRKITSKLPLSFQYYFYLFTVFPVSYVIKKIKGNKQNKREMMLAIFDWFSPEFRWEHDHEEAASWFYKRNYNTVKITTDEVFGFNIIGKRKGSI
jgi:SAM-dependent methyltransferase/uncharacterized protein YbaR (Trm112 family)